MNGSVSASATHFSMGEHIELLAYHCQILERPRCLNILQCFVQFPQLSIDLALGLLSTLYGLCLESFDSLELPVDVVCRWLELLEVLLNLVDHGGVLEGVAEMLEVDGLRHVAELIDLSSRVIVAFLKGREGSSGLAS